MMEKQTSFLSNDGLKESFLTMLVTFERHRAEAGIVPSFNALPVEWVRAWFLMKQISNSDGIWLCG